MGRKGFSLGQVVCFLLLLVSLAFLTAMGSLRDLGLAARASDAGSARNLATSALHLAIAHLREHADYQDIQPLKVSLPGYAEQEACGYVSFDPGNSLGLPYSLNNLASDTSRLGFAGTSVPAHTAHIMAVGRFRGLEHRLESVVVIPYLPYAVACRDRFESTGNLTVAGLRDLGPVQSGLDRALAGPLEPATALSNALGPSALRLGPGDVVNGNVQAVGNVSLDATANVTGETRQGYDPVQLAQVNVAEYDVAGRPGLVEINQPSFPGDVNLGSFTRRQGNLRVVGNLQLNDAVLYVAGNLVVEGGVRGVGAVITTGSCSIGVPATGPNRGGGRLGTDSFTAVLVQGDLSWQASAGQRAEIRGLVYVGGNFDGSCVDVVGSLVANGATSRVRASNCRLIHVPIQSVALGRLGDVSQVNAPLYMPRGAILENGTLATTFGPMEVVMDPVYRNLSHRPSLPLHYAVPDEVVQDPTKIWNYVREIRVDGQTYPSYTAFRAAVARAYAASQIRQDETDDYYNFYGWTIGHLPALPDYTRASWSNGSIQFAADQPQLDWQNPRPYPEYPRGDFPVPTVDERMAMTAKLLASSQWNRFVVEDRSTPQSQTWKLDMTRLLRPEDRIRTLLVRDR